MRSKGLKYLALFIESEFHFLKKNDKKKIQNFSWYSNFWHAPTRNVFFFTCPNKFSCCLFRFLLEASLFTWVKGVLLEVRWSGLQWEHKKGNGVRQWAWGTGLVPAVPPDKPRQFQSVAKVVMRGQTKVNVGFSSVKVNLRCFQVRRVRSKKLFLNVFFPSEVLVASFFR